MTVAHLTLHERHALQMLQRGRLYRGGGGEFADYRDGIVILVSASAIRNLERRGLVSLDRGRTGAEVAAITELGEAVLDVLAPDEVAA